MYGPPSGDTVSSVQAFAAQKIYVVDPALKQLLVYPSIPNQRPTTIVNLPDFAISVCCDPSGNVYVPIFNSNEVLVYNSGATSLLRTITAGITKPTGVVCDAAGNLYVGNHASTLGGLSTITSYAPGGSTVVATVNGPSGVQVEGIALDSNGNLVATLFQDVGGAVMTYTSGTWTFIANIAACNGICFSKGLLTVSDATALLKLSFPTYKRIGWQQYGVGHAVRFLTSSFIDGSLYVPIQTSTSGYVDVVPGNLTIAGWKISLGLQSPTGAAGGV